MRERHPHQLGLPAVEALVDARVAEEGARPGTGSAAGPAVGAGRRHGYRARRDDALARPDPLDRGARPPDDARRTRGPGWCRPRSPACGPWKGNRSAPQSPVARHLARSRRSARAWRASGTSSSADVPDAGRTTAFMRAPRLAARSRQVAVRVDARRTGARPRAARRAQPRSRHALGDERRVDGAQRRSPRARARPLESRRVGRHGHDRRRAGPRRMALLGERQPHAGRDERSRTAGRRRSRRREAERSR